MTSLHTRLFGLLATSWAILLLYFYATQRIFSYLAPDFHGFVLVGGIGMLILGLFSVINPQEKKASCDHDHDHDHHHHAEGCDHDHHHHDEECDHSHDDGHGPAVTILLTIIPLCLALTYSKDTLSTAGLTKKGLYEAPVVTSSADSLPFTREDLARRVGQNEHGEYQIRMMMTYYAAGDHEIQPIFDGLPIELEGRVVEEKVNNEDGSRMRIFRKMMTCCAADLQVVGVSMLFDEKTPRPKVDDWVKAGGILTFEKIGDKTLPILKIRNVLPTEEPYSEFLLRQ